MQDPERILLSAPVFRMSGSGLYKKRGMRRYDYRCCGTNLASSSTHTLRMSVDHIPVPRIPSVPDTKKSIFRHFFNCCSWENFCLVPSLCKWFYFVFCEFFKQSSRSFRVSYLIRNPFILPPCLYLEHPLLCINPEFLCGLHCIHRILFRS